jgi:hypothetical protein
MFQVRPPALTPDGRRIDCWQDEETAKFEMLIP